MFNQKVICTDNFMLLPPITQNVYVQLNMNADDDGFVASALTTARLCGGGINDLDELVKQDFLIKFERNVFLIRHWRLNNNKIQSDRYKKTIYPEFMQQVELDDNNIYRLNVECEQAVNKPLTENIQDVNENGASVNNTLSSREQDGHILLTQNRLEENRLDERRKDKTTTPALAGSLAPNLRNNRTTTIDPLIHKQNKSSSKYDTLPDMDDETMYSTYIKMTGDNFNKTIGRILQDGFMTTQEQNTQIKRIIADHEKQEAK